MTALEEKTDLEKIINAILNEISTIEAIYLFGSIAKGEENERSDYNIAVIVREYPEKDLDKIARIRYSLLGKIKRPLEILLIGMDDLEYSSPFLYEIYHVRRLLYGKDVVIRCKNIVEGIRPLIAEGNKIGYHTSDFWEAPMHYICVHQRSSAVPFLTLLPSHDLQPRPALFRWAASGSCSGDRGQRTWWAARHAYMERSDRIHMMKFILPIL